MRRKDWSTDDRASSGAAQSEGDGLRTLLGGPSRGDAQTDATCSGVSVGEILALSAEQREALVVPAGGSTAQWARSIVDLHGWHIGKRVLLAFERGLADLPIVIGVLRTAAAELPECLLPQATLESDGKRVIVDAEHELTLRCGKASITLTRDGRLELRGVELVSHADGANRIRGGSVELN